jgi:hypothetical protein
LQDRFDKSHPWRAFEKETEGGLGYQEQSKDLIKKAKLRIHVGCHQKYCMCTSLSHHNSPTKVLAKKIALIMKK